MAHSRRPGDTIAALSTAAGRSAIAVIRISGPDVPHIAHRILGKLPAPRLATLARFVDGQGRAMDRGVAIFFEAPHSFTGEHLLEIQGHGSTAAVDAILRRVLELGVRLALPGEFSERAFLNGKLDLAQAEAIADLIDATSEAAARAALRSLSGEFSARVQTLAQQLVQLRTFMEASIDFSEDDVDAQPNAQWRERAAGIVAAFDALLEATRQGVVLRDGIRVALIGEPNVGKSSLMNALAREQVAIVTDTPGTTRDVLKQDIRIGGVTLTLIDTAGIRDTHEPAEQEGVRRAKAALSNVDYVLLVCDAAHMGALERLRGHLPAGLAYTVLVNKIDLAGEPRVLTDEAQEYASLRVSARTGEGMAALRARLESLAGVDDTDGSTFTARKRHVTALEGARGSVAAAFHLLSEHAPVELVAEELRLAHEELGEITGTVTSEDLLGEIFSSFCIGK